MGNNQNNNIGNSLVFSKKMDKKLISNYTKKLMDEIVKESGDDKILITSTVRTPYRQAQAMYTNIKSNGLQSQYDLYGSGGDKVIDEYVVQKKIGKSKDLILNAMCAKIYEVGPKNVSNHSADFSKLNVLDVSPSSIKNLKNFKRILKSRGIFYISPGKKDPALHIEIIQPKNK